ncbi:MAG: murein biosynthesis integral membrane protein MurJ [Candidatus Wildermuthbacteria bacterium RIFCSPHIGHO2_02_FULL_47_12]|uniref:Probable lipid II flippase MurJ n=1 Tax=Candidatus Wildermuthbacteria bacterium RIFCSPHIGHO2_02_FULL_47_12 TaxID=1802451 RepID=A0A1G2R2K8_9BACT|nr:MAG: murein biosynthesis integral membrane protein MurJ [Candidatus Wildermuthbacteria bacterium RIFCSPHIGHO2_02_FULL_47_12]
MFAQLLNGKTSTVSGAAIILALSFLASRALGIIRDRMLTGTFGAGKDLDAYLAAFRIPDFLYAFLVIWGLSAVFLPLFSEYMAQDKEKAWRFVNNMMAVYALFLGVGSLFAILFMRQLVSLVAPGFEGAQLETAILLSRFMLASPLFFAFSAIASGVLQYFQKFVAYALAPVVYNLSIIGGIIFFAPSFGVFGVAMGVVIGAVLHFFIQVPPLLAAGFSFRPRISFADSQVRKALLLSVPRTVAGVAHQLNLIVMVAFASFLSVGSITIFTIAEHMYYFPVGVIGVSLATAAFPLLSRAGAEKNMRDFSSTFFSSLRRVALAALLAALILFFLREPLFRILYLSGGFTVENVDLAAAVFGVFTLGIVFQSAIPLLVRAFFALQNTVAPTAAGVSSVIFNIALAYIFLRLGLGIFALPWALVISGAFQCLLLFLLLLLVLKKNHIQP